MKTWGMVLAGLFFFAAGGLLLWTGSAVVGWIGLLFGLAGFAMVPVARAQDRGEPPYNRHRLRYALVGLALGAAIGTLFLVFGPSGGTGTGRRWTPDSPAEARIFGGVVLALCLAGAVVCLRRMTRPR